MVQLVGSRKMTCTKHFSRNKKNKVDGQKQWKVHPGMDLNLKTIIPVPSG